MNEIPLTGLIGSHPLGALAAFGLLRCCEEIKGFQGSRLNWRRETENSDWHAVLYPPVALTADQLLDGLSQRQQVRSSAAELSWDDIKPSSVKSGVNNPAEKSKPTSQPEKVRLTPQTFRQAARTAVTQSPPQRCLADFLAAFTCGISIGEDPLPATAFYMISGKQQVKGLLRILKELADMLRDKPSVKGQNAPAGMFGEALFGPWRYEDKQHPLGWDPSFERLHALRAKSPTGDTPLSVAAAVWLAFESLPLFPCFLSGGQVETRSFRRIRKQTVLSWPIWTPAIPLCTLRSLLALTDLVADDVPLSELEMRGVAEVFRSQRYKVKTQGAYYILRPAFPCTGSTSS